MARAKKKPLRGSIRQNTVVDDSDEPRFGFGMRLALLVLGSILLISLISWLWNGQWPRRQASRMGGAMVRITQKAGFSVSDVTVEGRHYTDRYALYEALGTSAGKSVFTFNPQEAHDNISKLPWVESVTVLRSMPDRIIIRLKERQPIARWQHDDKTVVIDQSGEEIEAARPDQFANLPLVVGNAAAEQTHSLLTLLADYPVVARVLKAAVRVGERRWNFYLHPNLLVRLPAEDTRTALGKLTKLIQDQKILDRNVIAVDLRDPSRMAIEPGTPPAAPNYGDSQE